MYSSFSPACTAPKPVLPLLIELMRINQSIIAKQAGVSRPTVSLAINHPEKLAPETLAKVNQAIDQLGYRPNMLARNFQQGRSGYIGMVFRFLSDLSYRRPFFNLTLKGLQSAAFSAHYSIAFQPLGDGENVESLYRSGTLDGLIYMTFNEETDGPLLRKMYAADIPFVLFSSVENLPHIDLDYPAGFREAVHRFQAAGRKKILWLGGGQDLEFNRRKYAGFLQGLQECGLTADPSLHFHDVWDFDRAEAKVYSLVEAGLDFDAIVAGDGDETALGALKALQNRGLKVPDHCGLIAGDGSYWSRLGNPPLASVVLPYEERARLAVEMLVTKLDTGTYPPSRTLTPQFLDGPSL